MTPCQGVAGVQILLRPPAKDQVRNLVGLEVDPCNGSLWRGLISIATAWVMRRRSMLPRCWRRTSPILRCMKPWTKRAYCPRIADLPKARLSVVMDLLILLTI
jgi:hypothetical protein